eukprot:TRINITY_DN550_c1_g1_i1.p1 TRINITY_DN550_c1_g1~~TRINITY_DN550_c1_g1_i1.p1  ORF type:complete len:243 (-),score=47.14 TRINITY_DN550_c1_g1_i1:397-1125(-)
MATSRTQFTTDQHDNLVFLNIGFPLTVEIEGKEWPTVEHYYLAMKFNEEEQQEKIRTSRLEDARLMACHATPGFEEVEVDSILMKGLRAKFSQYQNLAKSLASIKDHVIELKDKDPYLGNGEGTGKCGQNKLGILLAFMRKEINENPDKYFEDSESSGSESESPRHATGPNYHYPAGHSSVTFQSPPTLLIPMEGSQEDHFIGFNQQTMPPLENYYKPNATADFHSGLPSIVNSRIKHTSIL